MRLATREPLDMLDLKETEVPVAPRVRPEIRGPQDTLELLVRKERLVQLVQLVTRATMALVVIRVLQE